MELYSVFFAHVLDGIPCATWATPALINIGGRRKERPTTCLVTVIRSSRRVASWQTAGGGSDYRHPFRPPHRAKPNYGRQKRSTRLQKKDDTGRLGQKLQFDPTTSPLTGPSGGKRMQQIEGRGSGSDSEPWPPRGYGATWYGAIGGELSIVEQHARYLTRYAATRRGIYWRMW